MDGIAALAKELSLKAAPERHGSISSEIREEESELNADSPQISVEAAIVLAAKTKRLSSISSAIIAGNRREGTGHMFGSKGKEDPLRLLAELRETVNRLEAAEMATTPLVQQLEVKLRGLGLTSDKMYPEVQTLVRSFANVSTMVAAIEENEKGREGIDHEKWSVHQTAVNMQTEKFETALAACLTSKDLVAERGRVDGRIQALKLDLESLSADQMRNLRSLMGLEVGKVIDHVGNIKSSFDAALAIMRMRVEAIREDFAEHQEDMEKEKVHKAELVIKQLDHGDRQAAAEERLAALGATFEASAARHGTDIDCLQRDMHDSIAAAAALSETLAESTAAAAQSIADLGSSVDELRRDITQKMAAQKEQSEKYADEAAKAVKDEVLAALKRAQQDADGSGKALMGITEQLDQRLRDLDAQRKGDVAALHGRVDGLGRDLRDQWAKTEAAILASRDDAQRAIERTGTELGRSLAALTDQRVGELRKLTEDELRAMREGMAEAGRDAERAKGRIAEVETRATAIEGAAVNLAAAFKGAEVARDQWQRRQDGATRNYRLELDAHLQQMEELLNEKVSASRSDVVRLGRSNVALAAIVHQCRSRIAQLASQEEAADLWRLRLEVHAESLATAITTEEATASVERPYLLSVAFQKFMSSAVQNIAELLALLADNETVRAVIVHPEPASDDLGWDSLVDGTRATMARDFIAKVYSLAARAHPSIHPVVLQARTKIFTKVELALKIALSKHMAVRAAETILGRRPLDACAACNRPMTKTAAQNSEGDRRAIVGGSGGGMPGAGKDRPATAGFSPGRQRPSKEQLTAPVGAGSLHWAATQLTPLSSPQPGSLSMGGHNGLNSQTAMVPAKGGGGGYQGQGNGAYIMRGGFRMPKKTADGVPAMGNPDFGDIGQRPGTAPATGGGRGR